MAIKLKALRLPKTTGILTKAANRNSSTTAYTAIPSGLSINEIYFQDKTGVLAGERLGTEHNVWIPYTSMTSVPTRGDQLFVKLLDLSLSIANITWQSGNIVRITFEGGSNANRLSVGDFVTVANATNAANNGTFIINTINTYIEITNTAIIDNSKNETASPAVINSLYRKFEIVDVQDKILSGFENHYEINISHKND